MIEMKDVWQNGVIHSRYGQISPRYKSLTQDKFVFSIHNNPVTDCRFIHQYGMHFQVQPPAHRDSPGSG